MKESQIGPGQKITLVITIHEHGAMSVEGPVGETEFCLAMLDNAKDAVRNYKKRDDKIVIPGKDVSV